MSGALSRQGCLFQVKLGTTVILYEAFKLTEQLDELANRNSKKIAQEDNHLATISPFTQAGAATQAPLGQCVCSDIRYRPHISRDLRGFHYQCRLNRECCVSVSSTAVLQEEIEDLKSAGY